jgi:Ca-activated chloride channel family protein
VRRAKSNREARSQKITRNVLLVCVFLAAGLAFGQSSRRSQERPTFRIDVDMVFVKVSVTDPLNRYVTGLEREHFRVFEEKVEQTVSQFTQETAPISVGILFDISGSMKDNIHTARNSVARFLEAGNPDDEFFLVSFNQKTTLVQSFTHQSSSIRNQISFSNPGGRTALYDAVYLGLETIRDAKNEKKALILITDGEDNSSRYTSSEVREFAKESDVQIYSIGEEGKLGYGRSEIQNIVGLTGGRAFFPNNFNELDYYIDLIHAELRNQYVLGYVPKNKARDGKWRRLKVKLEPPEGLPKLIVHAKEGYYAAKN